MAKPIKLYRGETAYIDCVFTDRAGTAQDPSVSQQIRIADPTGNLEVTDAAMSDLSGVAGGWTYAHQIGASDEPGKWTVECIGKDGATPDVSIGRSSFVVVERVYTK